VRKDASENRLVVEEKSDGEGSEPKEGVSVPKPEMIDPEKIKLLSEQEPEELARLRVKWAKAGDNNPYKAIRNFCADCMGGSTKLVAECESGGCPLWKFRFGCKPLPQDISEQQRAEMRERAYRNFSSNAANDSGDTNV